MRADRHSSRSAVARALKQPTRKVWPGRPLPYLVLLRTGYAEHAASLRHLVVSYSTVSPLPLARRFAFCGAVRGSPLLDVIQRPALRSPDFPPRALRPAATIRPAPVVNSVGNNTHEGIRTASSRISLKKRAGEGMGAWGKGNTSRAGSDRMAAAGRARCDEGSYGHRQQR